MQRDATTYNTPTTVTPYKDVAFDRYITYCALGGLITDEEGKISRMTLSEFCEQVGIDRTTIWRWKNNTSDLAERIERRRNEIVPVSRVSAAYNQLYLLGMQSKDKRAAVEALKVFLGHFGNLQLPATRVDRENANNGLLDLLQAARKGGIIDD